MSARGGRGGDLRAQVLEASVKLIEEQGLAALSMREVARRAGVSHQAPYHHFADRQAILAAVAEEGFVLLAAALEGAAALADQDAAARLGAGGRAYVGFALEHPAHFRVMFRPDVVDLRQYPSAHAQADRAYAALEALVAGASKAGFVASRQEQGVVLVAWSMVHGLAGLILDGPLAAAGPERTREQQLQAAFGAFQWLVRGAKPAAKIKKKRR